ncbi:MAG: HPr family phosphocarrier protein [Bacteroidales bacterium]|nr:HPr family phosphocarrier protein [Bacteroidales bacterium]
MISSEVLFAASEGLHARPAGELVKMVKSMAPTKLTLTCGAKKVNAASMLSVLSLGLKGGTRVVVEADGGNEQEALEQVVRYLASLT